MRIGVDVMGGDHAPQEIAAGCLEALEKLQIEPTHSDVKKVTFEAPVSTGVPVGFDGGSMDLTGSAI